MKPPFQCRDPTIKKDYQYDSQKIGFPHQVQVKMAKGSQRKMIEIKKKKSFHILGGIDPLLIKSMAEKR